VSTDAEVTRVGIFDMQVCVPKSWSDEAVETFANTQEPCGTSKGWTIRRQGSEYLNGSDERVKCSANTDKVHIMLDA
jgi:hypothetical protein